MKCEHLRLTTVALILVASVCAGQDATTGAIGGRITDSSGAPLPGATVTVTSAQGARTVVSGADGRYLAPYLTPGSYDVRAQLDGFRPEERLEVEVLLAQRAHADFVLAPKAYSESVEVEGTTPAVEMTSAMTSTSLERAQLARLPVDRRLSNAFYLAPGVSGSGGAGASNPSISGASGLENEYVVDGVTINDPKSGGLGVSPRFYGSMGNGVTYEFVDGIQVRSAGTEAEYGQSTGGTINVVTRSGSNTWRLSLFAYDTPTGLAAARRRVDLVNGAVNMTGVSSTDGGLTLGGPLATDRAFIFVSTDPRRDTTTYIAPEGFPLRSLGATDATRDSVPYAGKLTLLANAANRFDVSAFGDPSTGARGPQYASTLLASNTDAFSSLTYGSSAQTARYQGMLSADWLFEGSVGRTDDRFEEHPAVDEWQITDLTVQPTVTTGGRGAYQGPSTAQTWQYQAKATYLLREHELKAGASYEEGSINSITGTTGPSILLPNGERTTSGVVVSVLPDATLGRIYRVTRGSLGKAQSTRGQYFAAFLQDRVFLSDRVTLSAGVRYEKQRFIGLAESHTFGDNWAPRLGVVWDALGNGRLRAYASAGLYFAKIPLALASLEFGGQGSVILADYYDAGLTQPIPDGVAAGGTTNHFVTRASGGYPIDPTAKTTEIREGAAGFEYELRPQLVVGLRYVYRDMPRVLEDVGTTSLSLFYTDPQHYKSVSYVITNPRDGYPATSQGVGTFEDPIHTYHAIELTFDKRFAGRWSLLGSYRWSRLVGDYEGFYRNDNKQATPAATGLFDYPINDPSYTLIGVPLYGFVGDIRYQGRLGAGPLPTDRTHEIKLYGAYALTKATNLGAGFWLSTGTPLQPMAANPVQTTRVGDIPEAPRGSGIQSVDGFRRRTPTTWSLDLHADHTFALGSSRLVVLADVFNVFDRQQVTSYDQNTQIRFKIADPDYGARTAYQDPRTVRLGVRFEI
jgi:Carboxypeptidase regulatory-like domain/TonB-dependent Receptor Plug Domain